MVGKRSRRKKSTSTTIRPPKHENLKQRVQQLVNDEKYAPTGHARKRLDQREVTMKEVRAALISGKRVTSNDEFHEHDDKGNQVNRWSYAFVKQGLDRKIKVCVSIDDTQPKPLLIVTVIDLK